MVTFALFLPLLARAVIATPRSNSLSSSRATLVAKRGLQKRGDKMGYAASVWNNTVELLTDINVAGTNFNVVLETGSADT
jgi:hypothetical protein